MENDVLDYLSDVGYDGPLKEEDTFTKSVALGVKDGKFRDLVVWLCRQLTDLLHLDEAVNAVTEQEDLSSFVMEISSLLKELGCPYTELVEGPVSGRLQTKQQCLKLLLFLVSELMAARMVRVDKPNDGLQIKLRESDTAKDLKTILLTLKFPRPPDNITPKDLFTKVESKLGEAVRSAPKALLGAPLLTGRLSTDQWSSLSQVQSELQQEYRLRREMLLKRLDVTIQSFQWSERMSGKQDALAREYAARRGSLCAEPSIHLSDVLAARQDQAIIEKTSSAAARKNTQSAVHKVIIGRVPDRGGRPSEQEAPPPEMPSWQKERAQGGGGGGFGGRGGGGGGGFGGRGGGGNFSKGGGRVQGGWNQRDDRSSRNDYQDDRGGQEPRGGDQRGGYRGDRGGQRGRGGRGRDYR